MNKKTNLEGFSYYECYPLWIVGVRWFLFLLFLAVSTFTVYLVKEQFAYLYVIYVVLCLSLVLPLSKCVNCQYYGKRCQSGWGKVAGYLFKKGDEEKFNQSFKYIILLYPIWLFPLIFALIQLLRKRTIFELKLFLLLILILFLERASKRVLGCRVCSMRKTCPEVNPK
jgi:hypothetical protein